MIIVRLTGGLGNQMFQYAFGRHLAEMHGTVLKIDLSFYADSKLNSAYGAVRQFDLDMFNVDLTVAGEKEVARLSKRVANSYLDRALNRILGLKGTVLLEPHYHFSETAYDAPDNVYLMGYWQSSRYFADIELLIREVFTFKSPPSAAASKLLDKINNTSSVCVHVRRGDFVLHPLNGLQGKDYVAAGERIFAGRVSNPNYFVFSDDIEWCEANLEFAGPAIFVSEDFDGSKLQDDLRLMGACKHFIIANSSFSWWAAWLSTYSHKIIVAPKNWFLDKALDTKDLIPKEWIRI